jgi:hypothetical protein
MLEKPEFDCNNLGAFYDCGCAEEEGETGNDPSDSSHSSATRADAKSDSAHEHLAVEISKEA